MPSNNSKNRRDVRRAEALERSSWRNERTNEEQTIVISARVSVEQFATSKEVRRLLDVKEPRTPAAN